MDTSDRRRMIHSGVCPACGGDLSVRVPRKVKVCARHGACGRLWGLDGDEIIQDEHPIEAPAGFEAARWYCAAQEQALLADPAGREARNESRRRPDAPAWTACPVCSYPHPGDRCDNPGCVASGNVPPEIQARREREAAEAAERERFARIRYGKVLS